MGVEVGGLLGLIVLVLDVIAIVHVLQSGVTTTSKVVWTVAILLLPVLGLLAWYLAGPRTSTAAA